MIEGLGLGLRLKYLDDLETKPQHIQWLEVLADHFHDQNHPIVQRVDKLLCQYPCVLHAVNLSLGSSGPLHQPYVHFLESLVERFAPAWVSDHLCFTHCNEFFFHDLLPIPFTYALLDHIAFKIDALQTQLKRPFLIENISSYLRLKGSELSEAQFIKALVEKTGCSILLDINNIVVTCHNHQESIQEFCDTLPMHAVKQIHMAGHLPQERLLIDTHSRPMQEAVLTLYHQLIHQYGPIPTCLEWDSDLPPFDVIRAEIARLHHEGTPYATP